MNWSAVGRLAERAMASRRFTASRLLRDLVSRSSRRVVMIFGILVALSQVGVSIGPLLAGLGVAGFVIGFAMQDSLSNFASGVLILIYRPFDVGDTVEAGEVFGMVRDMSLVNTTILTFDNQTLVVPNTKIWSGVIRNVTAQTNRRVDLTFDVSYDDDMAEVERILLDVVRGHDKVLGEPEPVVKLHELSDSAVKFVVRPWVRRDDYWDVYWDLTRAVKMRFDEAGISIPFPHRQVVVKGLESLLRERDAAALADGRGTGSS
jgi:small conductance mechanosensitive channel